ncbi:hypothetical protein HanRHA438_Chr11g0528771 [Helianthus annuus]|nr:hypothetical protein HanIR_Chr11g0555921 [Helianthus annuus]KAJ0872881.1 hypothetical protein HanRHA438_Chr11g0528771 [Helianthus annuus]
MMITQNLKKLIVMFVISSMMMIQVVWRMMVKILWSVIGRHVMSWGLDMWVRFELMLLKYEMESISANYVVPYDYYKAFTSLSIWSEKVDPFMASDGKWLSATM